MNHVPYHAMYFDSLLTVIMYCTWK